jgi:hypothetical protein
MNRSRDSYRKETKSTKANRPEDKSGKLRNLRSILSTPEERKISKREIQQVEDEKDRNL